jgi:uncharacterized protein YjbJ (UPF0337 family)
MNSDQFAGKWNQLKGSVRTKWGQLTDSDVEQIKGNREKLMGLVQERYGLAKEAANDQIDEWMAGSSSERASPTTYKAGGK